MVLMNEESCRLTIRKFEVMVCVKHQAFIMQVAYLRILFLWACCSHVSHKHQHSLMIGNLTGCFNFSTLIFCRVHRNYLQDLDDSHLQIFLDKTVITNYRCNLSETNPSCSPVKIHSFSWYKVTGKRIKHTRWSLGTSCHIFRDWCCGGLIQSSLMLLPFFLCTSADFRMK